MRALNRARLLWAYLTRQADVPAHPVEYIVETTAKCNLYCPMCPRESYPQPKEDMADGVFDRLVEESSGSGEHMMLIGLGEPFLDAKIFDRINYCERHGISTLLSTNGVLLDEANARKVLDSPLKHITLSFDGATKESYEFYRKGAKFERVRNNFVQFARMKAERKAGIQVVVQMVRMERNAAEVDEFLRFWKNVPGVDQVRIKEDETNLMRPDAGHDSSEWKHPCHYLWRGPMYVKHNGDVYPCCQSYMLEGKPVGNIGRSRLSEIFNGPQMRQLRQLHVQGRGGEIEMCSRCCTTIPHPLLVAGSLILHGETVRKLLPAVERLVYFAGLPKRWLSPPKPLPAKPGEHLVQISPRGKS